MPEQVDPLTIMEEDLKRALKKAPDQRQWAMAIDLKKCVGCHACTVSCIAENVLPPNVIYRVVFEEESGEFPNTKRKFIPRPCMQCDNPPCVPVCPVKATWKREDAIVAIDYNKCIGCGRCVRACPYNARSLDYARFYTDGTPKIEDYEKRPSFEYKKKWPRVKYAPPMLSARKCHFCIHRIENGVLGTCTTTCIGRATYFGDANDPDSLVSKKLKTPGAAVLRPELGTKPRVYYLGL